jgi:hypothetical protein
MLSGRSLLTFQREAASISKTSVNFYQTARRNIPEDSHLHRVRPDREASERASERAGEQATCDRLASYNIDVNSCAAAPAHA